MPPLDHFFPKSLMTLMTADTHDRIFDAPNPAYPDVYVE